MKKFLPRRWFREPQPPGESPVPEALEGPRDEKALASQVGFEGLNHREGFFYH